MELPFLNTFCHWLKSGFLKCNVCRKQHTPINTSIRAVERKQFHCCLMCTNHSLKKRKATTTTHTDQQKHQGRRKKKKLREYPWLNSPPTLFRVFMMTLLLHYTGIKPWEKMTKVSASVCLILATALSTMSQDYFSIV